MNGISSSEIIPHGPSPFTKKLPVELTVKILDYAHLSTQELSNFVRVCKSHYYSHITENKVPVKEYIFPHIFRMAVINERVAPKEVRLLERSAIDQMRQKSFGIEKYKDPIPPDEVQSLRIGAELSINDVCALAETYPNLRRVDLDSLQNITGESLKALAACGNLQEIDVSECSYINDEMLGDLIEQCSLRSITISRKLFNCYTKAFGILVKKSQLQSVVLRDCEDYNCFGHLTSLHFLVKEAIHLETLCLSQSFLCEETLPDFATNCRELRELDISYHKHREKKPFYPNKGLTYGILKDFAKNCPDLRIINLFSFDIRDDDDTGVFGGMGITQGEVRTLQREFPHITISVLPAVVPQGPEERMKTPRIEIKTVPIQTPSPEK